MFYGDSSHTVDDKGRVFVPKRFQDALPLTQDATRVAYVSRGQDACLYLFSESGFQRAVAELGATYKRPVFVSLEPVMGCGMGGCYSCVVPVHRGSRKQFVRAHGL